MPRSLPAVLVLLVLTAGVAQPQGYDPRVEAILQRMTLAEKVGEMTQIDISDVTRVQGTATVPQQIDSAKLDDIIVKHNVGSLLNVASVALRPQEWSDLTAMIQRFAQRRRIPVPVIYGIDAVHGHQFMRGGTIFPQNIAMAATWNPMLMRRASEITAYETRVSGIAWNFSPVLDVGRQPLWPRFYETFGEDPYLASVFGSVAIDAGQHDPTTRIHQLMLGQPLPMIGNALGTSSREAGALYVAATGKHFLGYSAPLSGKDRTTAWISDRQLREIFLPPFRAAIDAGVQTMMVNSSDINGVPVHASKEILTDLLRTELGFKGVVVSDYEDIIHLNTVHHVARNRREAVRMAIDAGIDMSMVPHDVSFIDDVLDLVKSGEIREERINESVRRILQLKMNLGLFENPAAIGSELPNMGSPAFAMISRRAAEESVVLLKNESGTLPIAEGKHVLITGPGATSISAMHGGWTYAWQGRDEAMYPRNVRTLVDALRAKLGANVSYVPTEWLQSDSGANAGVALARNADVIVVALAEPAEAEKAGDIDDLALPDSQLRLVQLMQRTGKPVVVTLFEARPRTIHAIVGASRAIVLALEPGPYGGEALASVLTGDVNPSGRLPFTYPRNSADIEHYDHAASADALWNAPTGGYTPEWDFGAGLSYTTFNYSALTLDRPSYSRTDTIRAVVTVHNAGARQGMDVIQVYSRQFYASVAPAVRKLRAFEKVSLAPGETRMIKLDIPVSRLAIVGRNDRASVEPGEFELQSGGLSAKFTVR